MSSVICFADQKFLPKSSLTLSIDDLAFSRGCCLFEHLKTFEKVFFHSHEHLQRLFHSAAFFNFKIPCSMSEMLHILEKLEKLNGFKETGCKIYLTGGTTSVLGEKPSLYMVPYEIKERPSFKNEGISLKTTEVFRLFREHKTTIYLPGLFALSNLKSKEESFDDILYLDEEKNLLESTTSSFLAFIGNTLYIPEKNILPSITQEILIRLAYGHFKVERGSISYDRIEEFSEAFLAASIAEIVPIRQIDSFLLPKENPNTRFLKGLFDSYIKEQNWPILEAFSESVLAAPSP